MARHAGRDEAGRLVSVEDATALASMPLAQIVTFWQPGSANWSWAEEYADVLTHGRTAEIRARVDSEGIGFADHIAPIFLGSDGRVWDGHHRICIAIQRGIQSLMAERQPAASQRPSKPLAAQLAPPTRTSATEAQREDKS